MVLSGHDHHVVDRMVDGTRLLKPGQDGIKAVILDLTWPTSGSSEPCIEALTRIKRRTVLYKNTKCILYIKIISIMFVSHYCCYFCYYYWGDDDYYHMILYATNSYI